MMDWASDALEASFTSAIREGIGSGYSLSQNLKHLGKEL